MNRRGFLALVASLPFVRKATHKRLPVNLSRVEALQTFSNIPKTVAGRLEWVADMHEQGFISTATAVGLIEAACE